ncbi:cathepsin O-like [Aphomia sociella]
MEQYDSFVLKYKKSYNFIEYAYRLGIYKDSKEYIDKLNDLENNVVYGYSKFADMSQKEFENMILIKNVTTCERSAAKKQGSLRAYPADIPTKVDWRRDGVVGPVLQQKLCRGCWSFCVVGVMETMFAIGLQRNGSIQPLTRLSIQELIDCSTYNEGCRGGKPATAIKFLKDNNLPILTEQYPLKLADQDCMIHNHQTGVLIRNYTNLCNVEEEDMLRLIANHGPLIAAVNAKIWQYYVGGVIQQGCLDNEGHLNHVVQIVGYDLTATLPHFIIRNSWGEDFGDKGYVKIAIGSNVCGIADEISYIYV